MSGKVFASIPRPNGSIFRRLHGIRERSLDAALDFESEFQRAVSAIEHAPERWPPYISHCRRYVLHQFPFSVVYRLRDEEILVLAVAHAHRKPGY